MMHCSFHFFISFTCCRSRTTSLLTSLRDTSFLIVRTRVAYCSAQERPVRPQPVPSSWLCSIANAGHIIRKLLVGAVLAEASHACCGCMHVSTGQMADMIPSLYDMRNLEPQHAATHVSQWTCRRPGT